MPRKKVALSDVQPYDPRFHDAESRAGRGYCSWHGGALGGLGCVETPIISFRDEKNARHSGCKRVVQEQGLEEEVKKWEHQSTDTQTET